jgi:hypothetical protein
MKSEFVSTDKMYEQSNGMKQEARKTAIITSNRGTGKETAADCCCKVLQVNLLYV